MGDRPIFCDRLVTMQILGVCYPLDGAGDAMVHLLHEGAASKKILCTLIYLVCR